MKMVRPVVKLGRLLLPAVMLCTTVALSWQTAAAQSSDPVILSFSTLGDSRQDPTAPDPTTLPVSAQDQIWLQNTKAWSRILNTIQTRKPAVGVPNLVFFNGDMIMGYGWAKVPANNTTVSGIMSSDLMAFNRQYGFWRGMVAGPMETTLYVVPVPGNHEVQCKSCGKVAKSENEDAWRANMADLILDSSRFQNLFGVQPGNTNTADNSAMDNLSTDQSKLSFSFDLAGSHFVVINTDPVGNDAHAPTQFLAADLAAAAGRGIKNIFVFGHKPAYTYYYGKNTPLPTAPSGLDNFPTARDQFWQVIEQYKAVYFCGHEHIFHIEKPLGYTDNHSWQVLVGSGGSPFEAKPTDVTINPQTDRDYAWVTVNVQQSGRVTMTAYGFDDHYGTTKTLGYYTLK
jgi:hypothetical protein